MVFLTSYAISKIFVLLGIPDYLGTDLKVENSKGLLRIIEKKAQKFS